MKRCQVGYEGCTGQATVRCRSQDMKRWNTCEQCFVQLEERFSWVRIKSIQQEEA